MRAARRVAHRLADPVAEAVEPLRKAAHMAGDLALVAAKLLQAGLDALAPCILQHLDAPRRAPPGEEGDGEQHRKHDGRAARASAWRR